MKLNIFKQISFVIFTIPFLATIGCNPPDITIGHSTPLPPTSRIDVTALFGSTCAVQCTNSVRVELVSASGSTPKDLKFGGFSTDDPILGPTPARTCACIATDSFVNLASGNYTMTTQWGHTTQLNVAPNSAYQLTVRQGGGVQFEKKPF